MLTLIIILSSFYNMELWLWNFLIKIYCQSYFFAQLGSVIWLSMSSPTDTLAALSSVQYYLFRFACPIVMLLGSIGGIINLMVFIQKILRKNSCSIYFIAYNIVNIIYIYAAPFYATLNIGYNIDASIQNLVLCRLRLYTTVLFNCLCSFYLVLAAIDRVLITSSNVRTWQRSTLRMAYIYVIGGIIFWVLFHSHEIFLTNINCMRKIPFQTV